MIRRGDICFVDLPPVVGLEQGGTCPASVIQNNLGSYFSPTIIVAAITAKMAKPEPPAHIGAKATGTGIGGDSAIPSEQIKAIDKSRLKGKVCHLDQSIMAEVDRALKTSIGIEVLTPVTK